MGDRIMPPPRGPVNPRKRNGDWNLLKSRAKNLAGRDEVGMRGITKAEVRLHNSQHDCWSIFRGKVYNLTPFLHYHPGGIPEIMKGAGKDCTALYDKYHPWVNFESLVGNLYLGPLVAEEELEAARGGGDEAKKVAAESKEGTEKADQHEAKGKAGGDENDDGGNAGGGDDGDGDIVDRTALALEHLSSTDR
eukprot:g15901.t2